MGGYEDDQGYEAGRRLVESIFEKCKDEGWLVGDSGANRFLYDGSIELGLMSASRAQPSSLILNLLYGTHTDGLYLNISMDDYALTLLSVFCAELAKEVRRQGNVCLFFFCGLANKDKDRTLRGSTVIWALIYQIFQQNMQYFTASEVESMFGDFERIIESQNLRITDLCGIFSGLLRLAEPRLSQHNKKNDLHHRRSRCP